MKKFYLIMGFIFTILLFLSFPLYIFEGDLSGTIYTSVIACLGFFALYEFKR